MKILPAIDILNGQCVRLYQGDMESAIVYNPSPLAQALTFTEQGAEYLHVVDLEGANKGRCTQFETLRNLHTQSGLKLQAGGGLRQSQDIEALLAIGIPKLVLGSLALTDSHTVKALIAKWGPERFVLAADMVQTTEGELRLVSHGWQKENHVCVADFFASYQREGVNGYLCTDVQRDGTLTGANLALYSTLLAQFPTLKLQFSGGICSLSELATARELGADAVIIGKALYENRFTLQEALKQ